MLADAEREAYRRDGYVVVRGAVPEAACAVLRRAAWKALQAVHGMAPDAPETWRTEIPRGLAQQFDGEAGAAAAVPALIELIDAFLGRGTWAPPRSWLQLLPLFPTPGPWEVPFRGWHVDYPVRPGLPAPFAVKLLCLLAPLAPEGGGTLLLAGSHRLLVRLAESGRSGSSSEVRKRLRLAHPWLRELMTAPRDDPAGRRQSFMGEGAVVDGIHLRVVELTGDTGDAVLFHPWLLHCAPANCSGSPRLLAGQNFTTREGLRIYRPAE